MRLMKSKNGTIESKYNHEVKSFDIREVVKVILAKMNELNKTEHPSERRI